MNIRDVLRDLVADAEDAMANERAEHDQDAAVANAISQAPQIVEGKCADIIQTHNAIFIAGFNNAIPVSLKRFKIWPLLTSTEDDANDDEGTPPAFCTPESVVEAPAHLTCKRCQEGPREIHGFPGSTTYSAHPRCLFNLNSKSESVACVACLRSNRARLDRCGIDEKAVREWLVQQQLLKL
ncbi:hypothetical protein PENSPDRAFT_25572 [Peniophora sp. CONT]|nr:hypothetical protein PENSPDRAFT_25572 [Peniophora sp. CONT]